MKILTGLLAALVASAQASAAEPERDPEQGAIQGAQAKFSSLDRDGDRQLTRSEAHGALAAQFASVDADDDGYIGESEYVAHVAVPSEQRGRGIRDEEVIDPFDPSNPAR